ncbi:4-aminobutyrate aminotransferase [Marinibacterium profundimaris]|uniref:4-aminobutyrate aminotransferase n=2 Tax=Marinibacterium profundimaris TaxID=1679460 RepID=A0A225NT50_9RHOB|nr:aminotransferase class III-fold pyridoxal phosphate-dependent enzyme [Marinibacterium profundimaris]OWU74780.1 4-aminobutyrate aminotransferase [Marinibacterium profundimaris]
MSEETRQILDMNAFRPGVTQADPAVARRLRNLGAASVLFYREPIEMVAARGAWMEAKDGRRYLDCYNNVPSVGHSHPQVVAAVCDQIGRLNTNTRYVVEVVDTYIDALKAKLPESLENVVLTCSGSEANDLALRVARAATRARGVIVTETAYHGNTELTTQVSPSAWKRGGKPDWVECIPAPTPKTARNFGESVARAMAALQARGHRVAALLADSIFSSDGVYADPQGFLDAGVEAVRLAGGLFIADEVQPGFARTGSAFWGFARHGVVPDMVTMGKPMGNGFPMAGLAARPEHLAMFCRDVGYFNTFGGNPVAAAAGLAVLRVIADEGLEENAAWAGGRLKSGLGRLAKETGCLGEIRGAGLFLGVDIRKAESGRPDPDRTSGIINGLRDEGVLIGAAGKHGATLKIRPPLCLSAEEVDHFLGAFERVVAG